MRSTQPHSGARRPNGTSARLLSRSLPVLAAAMVVATPFGASAQGGLLGGLKKRATDAVEQKATQKVNQKIDEKAQQLVDKSFDSMFGGDDKGSGGSGGGGGNRRFSLLPNAPTESSYQFDGSLTYETEVMPKGKPSGQVGLVTMLYNRDGLYMGTKLASAEPKKGDGDLTAIFDVKNESMVMLMQNEKEKMSMAYSWKDAKKYAESAPASTTSGGGSAPTKVVTPEGKTVTFTSLGTRTIAGYKAEGYKGSNEDGDVEVWVTRDANLPSGRFMGAGGSMKQMRGVVPTAYPTGLLLEVRSTDRKSGDQGRMTVKSIDTKASIRIDMADYPRLGATK